MATPSLVRSAGRRPIHRDPGGFFPEPDQRGHVLIRQTSRGGLEEALLGDRAEQQRDPALRAIPTLIVTAGTVTSRVEALGAEAILRKPVSLRRLVDTIRRFC